MLEQRPRGTGTIPIKVTLERVFPISAEKNRQIDELVIKIRLEKISKQIRMLVEEMNSKHNPYVPSIEYNNYQDFKIKILNITFKNTRNGFKGSI